jgi:hypothetical protein
MLLFAAREHFAGRAVRGVEVRCLGTAVKAEPRLGRQDDAIPAPLMFRNHACSLIMNAVSAQHS